jgi:aldehyde dehydrogenase (NAD+)
MALGGQWCTSPGYAYVHESVAQTFVEEARKALVSLYGVHSSDNPDYSRIISGHAVRRLAGMIDPAKVVADGESDADARYLDPTILYPVQWEDEVMAEEVLGRILAILTYGTLDEALRRIATTPRPLGAFIFSRNQKAIDRFIAELSFGAGAVNQVNIFRAARRSPRAIPAHGRTDCRAAHRRKSARRSWASPSRSCRSLLGCTARPSTEPAN